jgi:hypothetical protein
MEQIVLSKEHAVHTFQMLLVTRLEVLKELVSGSLLLMQLLHHAEPRLVLIFQMEPQQLHVKEFQIVFLMEQIVSSKLLVLHIQPRLDVNHQELMDYVFGLKQLPQPQLENVL